MILAGRLESTVYNSEGDVDERKRRTREEAFGERRMSARRHRQLSTKTYVELHEALHRQEYRLAKVAAPANYLGRAGVVVEAAVAYLLTRPEHEQDRILREGARIVELINQRYDRDEPVPDLAPGSYAPEVAREPAGPDAKQADVGRGGVRGVGAERVGGGRPKPKGRHAK